jgi:hypothetical protein
MTDDTDDGPFLTPAEMWGELKIGRTQFKAKVSVGVIPPPDICLGPRSHRYTRSLARRIKNSFRVGGAS